MAIKKWQREILLKGDLYRVGGAVRDEVMGYSGESLDRDYLVRRIKPRELEEVLSKYGRVFLVGRSFGVYKFTPEGEEAVLDIAYPRKELSTGPGHKDFLVGWDWKLSVEADLGRRDFTINALAQDVRSGKIVDPFGGRKDIERRLIRMIFPAAFSEDPLRILRGIRFAARFSFQVEEQTLSAMEEGAALMSSLSPERIKEELNKLMSQCPRPSEGFDLMRRVGVLKVVLPELDRSFGVSQNEYHPDDVFAHSLKTCDCAPRENLRVRWAALLHDLGKVARKKLIKEGREPPRVVFYQHEEESARIARDILLRLRFANSFVRKCEALVRHHMFHYEEQWSRAALRRFIRRVGEENLEDLFELREADCRSRDLEDQLEKVRELQDRIREEIESGRALDIKDMAVGGEDIMKELGISEGPEVGRILRELFEMILEDPALNNRAALLGIMRKKYKR